MLSLRKLARKGLVVVKDTVGALMMINILLALAAFFKDVMLAVYTGTSAYADAISIAFFVPDMIGNNLLAFSLGISCVPVFTRLYVQKDRERLYSCIRKTTLYYGLLAVVITLLFFLFSRVLVQFLTGDPSSPLYQITLPLYYILLPTLMFFTFIAIGTSLLQTLNRFISAALSPLLLNLIFLGILLICLALQVPPVQGMFYIALSIAVGVVAMFTLTGWFVFRQRQHWYKQISNSDPLPTVLEQHDFRQIMHTFVPFLLIILTSQFVYFFERYLAARMPTGSIAALNYAFRLSQFPIWVFVAAVSTVALPAMAKYIELGKADELKSVVVRAVKNVVIISLPISIFLSVLNAPIVSVLFQRGEFDAASTHVTSGILAGYSLAIVGLAISMLCLRYFMAAGSMLIPLGICIFSAAANIGIDFWLVPRIGATGFGYGAAMGALINAVLIIIVLKKQLKWRWSTYFDKIVKIVLCNALLYFIMVIYQWVDETYALQNEKGIHFTIIVCTFITCTLVYAYCLRKLRIV